MRLLNTKTLEFKEFFDNKTPIYAILSHRWGAKEVSHLDFRMCKDKLEPEYAKILGCCRFASYRAYAWVWIDSCCIDKTSSAELSEAINSMYRWYENAAECYVYLNDVNADKLAEEFIESKWFTRGWTLQELLAPHRVVFLDRAWRIIGSRETLADQISKATGIPKDYLLQPRLLRDASVAMKMSWASRRETSRLEDRAYSLLGLFGVNMPMLYGEGRNAFRRLQLEILKISDDESLFAWEAADRGTEDEDLGMLAAKPEDFVNSGKIVRRRSRTERPTYSMTHKGLKLNVPSSVVKGTTRLVLPLDCTSDIAKDTIVSIVLYKPQGGYWARPSSEKLGQMQPKDLWTRSKCSYPEKTTIYILQPNP